MITKAEISLIRSLADKRSRDEHGLFVVEGRKMVAEALVSQMKVVRVFGTEEFLALPGCEIVSRTEIERMSSLRTPQGVLALVAIPQYELPAAPGRELTIALDGVQDPGNLGTIMRIADWFGINDIICSPDSADCFGPKAVQASMGAVLRVRVHYAGLPGILQDTLGAGIPVYGTFLGGEDIYRTDFAGDSGIVVLGSEGNGIRPETGSVVSRKLYIPPYPSGDPSSESLNVGVAAAIICSEFRRRIIPAGGIPKQ